MTAAQAIRNNPGKSSAGALAFALAALAAVYVNEGGYVNDPTDRGGPTRYGITEKVARQWGYKGNMRDFPKHCDALTPVCSDIIYKTDYIDKPGFFPFASMEPAVLDELVDSAVLHGPNKPSRWLQLALNAECGSKLKVDGAVGPATVGAYAGCRVTKDPLYLCVAVLNRMDKAQEAYFDAIIAYRPSQKRFERGWKRARLNNVPRAKCQFPEKFI